MGKRDGLFTAAFEVIIDDVEQLEERHVGIQIRCFVVNELTLVLRTSLTPNAKGKGNVFRRRRVSDHDGRISDLRITIYDWLA